MKGIQAAGERNAPNSFPSSTEMTRTQWAIAAVGTGEHAMQTIEH
jgi:hypothetical protein